MTIPDPNAVAPVEAHRDRTRTPAWAHTAAARAHGWGLGRELPADDYEAAIKAVMGRAARGETR